MITQSQPSRSIWRTRSMIRPAATVEGSGPGRLATRAGPGLPGLGRARTAGRSFPGCRPRSGHATISSRTARRCRCPPRRPRFYQPPAIGQPWRRPQNRAAGDDFARPGATGQHSHSATGRERDQDRCTGRGPHPPGAKSCWGAAPAVGVCAVAACRRGSGAMVRPGAGNGHADQQCPSGNRGDRPHPPWWLRPAAKLRHTL